ncbi:MAG: biotin/lipoyl-binding protein, partial [Cyanobacteria bacterium J06627_8]
MTNQFSDPMKGPENQLNASGDFHQLALPFDHYSTVDVNSGASHRDGDRPVRDWMQVKSLGRIGLVHLVIGIAIAWTRQQGDWLAPSATAVATQTSIWSVDAVQLEQADAFTIARHYSGEVVAGRTSELGFEQSGELVWVGVDRGDRVEVGQVLARLDIRQLQAQRSQLVAQRDQSQALLRELEVGPRQEDIDAARSRVQDLENQLQLSRIQETRREYLYEEGAISQEQLDEASFG